MNLIYVRFLLRFWYYISDDIVSEIKPYLDDNGELEFTFRDSNIQSYIDLFTNDKFYFLDQILAESLLVDMKKNKLGATNVMWNSPSSCFRVG